MGNEIVNRNARPTIFGFEFQEAAGLILMLENIKNVKEISIEGPHQDIEVLLSNNKKIYAQAKATTNPYQKNTLEQFKKGLLTLIENSSLNDFEKLVYVTNSLFPFGKSEIAKQLFAEREKAIFKYGELEKLGINVDSIIKKISSDTDEHMRESLEVHFHRFIDANDERTKYELVYKYLQEFLQNINDGKYRTQIFELWTNQFHRNASQTKTIIKSDFIWKMIVRLSDIRNTEGFKDFFGYDNDEIEEIEERFRDEVENLTNGFELSNAINSLYLIYRENNASRENREFKFIENNWESLQERIITLEDKETQKIICQLVIWEVIKNRSLIKKTKEAAGI